MTVELPVEVSGFSAGPVSMVSDGSKIYSFSLSDILRAAIVAGYWDEISTPSREFRQWRAAAIRIAVRQVGNSLIRPPEWRAFDPSEKGMITSLLGITVTKLLTERILGAPFLLFLDVHFRIRRMPGSSAKKPDFVAIRPGVAGWEYFSIEAKGRARFSNKTLANGKTQAESLGTVDLKPVVACVVCVTSFSKGALRARFHDPIPGANNLHNAEAGQRAVRGYYGSLRRLLRSAEPMGFRSIQGLGTEIELWAIPELDVLVGLHPLVAKLLSTRSDGFSQFLLHDEAQIRSEGETVMGPDGIIVIPGSSWYL